MDFLSMFIARKSFITFLIIDYINLFILIIFTKSYSEYNSILNLSVLLLIFIPWFFLSYFSDKNKRFNSGFITKIKAIIIKTFIVTAISFCIIQLFISLNNENIELTSFLKLFSKNFYFYLFLSNTAIQILIEFLKKSFLKYKENWLCIGKFKIEENFINSNKIDYLRFVYYRNYDKKIKDKIYLNSFKGIIILDSLLNTNDEFINFIIDNSNIRIFSFSKWCEKYLKLIPSECLDKNLINNHFFGYKNNLFQLKIKRVGDITFSLILILFSLPLVIIMAIIIKLEDGGPILYSQKRIGLNLAPYTIFKLRSMHINAEKEKAQWSCKNDPRVTNIGKFLRKTRIDEIPQLFSVLKGEMSLIGPRPERPEFYSLLESEIPNYRTRCLMRPGLSGWAQVNYPYGSNTKDAIRKMSYDMYYLNNFSTYLDFIIMFITIKVIIQSRGT